MGHTRREQQARGKVELQEPLRAAQVPSGLFSCHFRFSLGAAFILPSREPSPRMSMAVTTPASSLSLEWPRKERWAPLLQAELKNLQEETESGQTEKKQNKRNHLRWSGRLLVSLVQQRSSIDGGLNRLASFSPHVTAQTEAGQGPGHFHLSALLSLGTVLPCKA